MLTILTNPSDHNFSKSPVVCEIETDNRYTSGDFGNKAKFTLFIPPVPVEADEIIINLVSGGGIRMYFTAGGFYPFGTPVRLNPGGITTEDYYQNYVLPDILAGFIPTQYNVIYIGSGGFMFEALLTGNNWSFLSFGVNQGLGYSCINVLNGSTDWQYNVPRPNYKLGIDVWVERAIGYPANTFDKVFSADKEPLNNKVWFDISKILDTQLQHYFPDPNLSGPVICSQACKRFYVHFRESFGNPVADQVVSAQPDSALVAPGQPTSFEAFVLKAGFSPVWNKKQPKQQLQSYIWNYPLLLTVCPPEIKIKRGQPQYIYFCFDVNRTNPKVRITKYLKDGTTSVGYETAYSGTMYQGFVGCFPTTFPGGIIYNTLTTGEQSGVIKITADLVENSNPTVAITPPVTYYPDYNELGDDKIFLFDNSMGGIDTFRSTGRYEQDTEIEKEVSTRMYKTTDADYLGCESSTQNKKTDYFTVYSGWQTKEQIEWLEEIYLAKNCVEVQSFVFYRPITITSSKIRKHDTVFNLYRLEMEYKYQMDSLVTDRLAAAL